MNKIDITCFKAYDNCRSEPLKTVVYSTAEWTKFSPTIANALTGEIDTHDIEFPEAFLANLRHK